MKFFNIILRVLIFATILLVAYLFFKPDTLSPERARIKTSNLELDSRYDIYFVNPSKDSIYITGNLFKRDNRILVEGKIKSLSRTKLKYIDIEFKYFDENNILIGKESLTIQKVILPKSLNQFVKEGLTIPEGTVEIRIQTAN